MPCTPTLKRSPALPLIPLIPNKQADNIYFGNQGTAQ